MEEEFENENICNFCVLSRIRKRAAAEGKFVRLRPAVDNTLRAGVNVYVVPEGRPYHDLKPGLPAHDEHFKVWMQGIGDHCSC